MLPNGMRLGVRIVEHQSAPAMTGKNHPNFVKAVNLRMQRNGTRSIAKNVGHQLMPAMTGKNHPNFVKAANLRMQRNGTRSIATDVEHQLTRDEIGITLQSSASHVKSDIRKRTSLVRNVEP